jgi:glucokinase
MVDAEGGIVAMRRVATSGDGPEAVVAQIGALVAAVRRPGAAAIGIGVPGAIDAAAGLVLNIPALPGWGGFPLVEQVGRSTGLSALIENDAKAAALGEFRAGAGRGVQNVAYVTIGTGIGGGMIVDGRLLRGAGGLAGEVGHTHVTDSPEICACGRTGCWQAVASGTALGRDARNALGTRPDSEIARVAGDAPVTAVHVAAAGRLGDPLARELLRRFAQLIGMGLANVQHCYSPELIVLGGGVSMFLDLLQADIEAALRAGLLPGFRPARIVPAALGDDSGIVGAAMLAREALPNA